MTFDYAFDKSRIDEANANQELVGLTPVGVNPVTGALTDRLATLNGMIAAGNAAVNFGAGPLAVAAAGDPTFQRWLDSAKLSSAALANTRDTDDRPGNGSADALSETTGDNSGHSLTAAWNFDDLGALGAVEFKSITGWRDVSQRNRGDLDGVDNTIAPGGAGALNDPKNGSYPS